MSEQTPWPFAGEDPYDAYRAAREEAPVQWSEDLDALLVLSHEHAADALRGREWSSDPRNNPRLLALLGGSGPVSGALSRSLLMSDLPAHTRLRAGVSRFFTPRSVHKLKSRVAAIVDSAFGLLAADRPVELMSELAQPIPLAMMAELFDIGLEGAQLLREHTPRLVRVLEVEPTPEDLREASDAAFALMLFLVPVLAHRRASPGEDLLSALVHAGDGAVALETDEIVTTCLLLLAAGHETTANLIGNGALALCEHPREREWLARHPDRCAQAVEELLRYDSPVQLASRIAVADLDLDGVAVRKGERALVVLGAANRDPGRHLDPDRLDLSRGGPSHLAFGSGPHYCVGAALARMQAQEVFARLAALPSLSVIDGSSRSRDRSLTFRRLRSLHVASACPGSAGRPATARGGALRTPRPAIGGTAA